MSISVPKIIQGGMGIGVSNWRLARAVSRLGELGVVSGTALDQVLARRLQDGDLAGDVRRALATFPFPSMAQRVLDTFFVEGGKQASSPYKISSKITLKNSKWFDELCIVANYVEVFLAREGHANPVGINYLEKIQLPHLPSLYGALLGGVAVVIVGAGIPLEFSKVLDRMVRHEHSEYTLHVHGVLPETEHRRFFNPADFIEEGIAAPELEKPKFLPIISSDSLATMLLRKSEGTVDGFVIETSIAGGHNAPPRGKMTLTETGQPIYGPRDVCNLEKVRAMGRPFWLGGGYGSPEGLKLALGQGASGIQVGTVFALCQESGVAPELRRKLLDLVLAGEAKVFTDPRVSPTGFPFKVAELEGTVFDKVLDSQRRKICDLGYLREAYQRDDGEIGFRCPAEPDAAFIAKGGSPDSIAGRTCVCNSLFATIGLGQTYADGIQAVPVVTLGDDFPRVERLLSQHGLDYSAEDVVRYLRG
ncbi:MAG: nitronate monooxygenase [Kiritimatiellia bacterium]